MKCKDEVCKCDKKLLFTSDATGVERVKIVNCKDGKFEITIQNCECKSVTDYKLTSLAHGGARLELTVELDNPTILIEPSTSLKV